MSPIPRTLLAVAALVALAPLQASTNLASAPDFTLPRLDGPALRLGEQRGQVVMLNFWASWCAPNKLHDKYRDAGFVLLGINVDDDPAKAAAEAARYGLRFPVLLDRAKAVSKLYQLGAMPTTIVIDRDGRVRHVHLGYRHGLEQVYDAQLRALVRE